MNVPSSFLSLVLTACFVLLSGQQPAAAQTDGDPMERLRAKYESIDALRAEFTQTMTSEYSDTEETFEGTVILDGDRYRVEAGQNTFVTDGKVTWIYDTAKNQVLINDYVEDETAFSLNDFFFESNRDFELTSTETETVDGEAHLVLHLTPKRDDAFFSDVTIWMRERDDLATRLEVLDVNGTKMAFRLDNIELNPPVDDEMFTFTPPEGTEVVDLRS